MAIEYVAIYAYGFMSIEGSVKGRYG